MSEVIRSSMSSIPDENWERAFGKKEDGLMMSPEAQKVLFETLDRFIRARDNTTNEC